MIGFTIDEAKSRFFDELKILDAAERAELKALSKFGAYVRQRAISSIRSRKKVSEPGMPPSSHLGLLKKFIYFFVERADKNVVIGPILLNRSDGSVPRLLEHGGDAMRQRAKGKKPKKAHYRARPFMKPAFDAEIAKAPELLRDSVK